MASARPSTSGSLTAKGSSRSNLDKRMSKDDMFFRTARQKQGLDKRVSRDDMYIRSRMAEMSQYHVPVRGSTLTPEHSPNFPVIHEVSIPIRVQTPESITSGEIPIGMALGSPPLRPDPSPSRWQAQFPPASPQMISSSEPSSAGAAPVGSLQRKKTGRRKLFGGLFGGGKKKEEVHGLAQTDAGKSTITLARTVEVSTSSVNVATKPTPTRSNTQAERKVPKHKPIMIRSNTMPQNVDEPPTQPKSAGLPGRQGNTYRQQQANIPPIPSFLDVNIPDTKLERYSVMFSDLLGHPQPKQDSAGSLLLRRQATLQRLKTIDDKVEAEEMEKERSSRQRRATSPQPTATPQLRLFPMPSEGRVTPALDTPTSRSRQMRSNTSPGRLPSPTQATFDTKPGPSAPSKSHGPTLVVPNPFENSPPQTRKQPKRELEPIYPTDTSFHFGPDKSGLILDSPTEMDSPADEIVISQPFKPTLHEPQWQMVSPQSVSASSTAASVLSGPRQRSPSAASSATAHTHATKPSSDLDEADAAFQSAVEVSIARQISISRQQRQLLRPLQTRRGTAGAERSASVSPLGVKIVKSPSPSRRLTDEESIKETKSSTPTLIHPRESPVNPAHLAQNRKSSWAVVEGG
ncbi:hypothetical protein N8I77_000430 [Diaporthe amygdali]|uniref:Uncharacterized protein n=1 Tax=Phomopsis amygdali TaxID=1214568 RepID=A0AAD9SNB5_PHOAM|nr:hypothetical protein N8I77_000430 [Diaporthe amygdali]